MRSGPVHFMESAAVKGGAVHSARIVLPAACMSSPSFLKGSFMFDFILKRIARQVAQRNFAPKNRVENQAKLWK